MINVQVFTMVQPSFHFLCVNERVLNFVCDFTEIIWRFLVFLEGNEAYVPIQLEAYRNTIFI